MVDLCHYSCHLFGPNAVHNNPETMLLLHKYGQRKAMRENGWTVEDFIREFGKNYLDINTGGIPYEMPEEGSFK